MNEYWTRAISDIKLLDEDEKKEYERSVRPAPDTVEQILDYAVDDIDNLSEWHDSDISSFKKTFGGELRSIVAKAIHQAMHLIQQKNKT